MKKLVLALAFLLVFPVAWADDDDGSDDRRYKEISECGTVIDQPGHYRLVNDLLNCNDLDPGGAGFIYAIVIIADKVVLDLDGHTVSCESPEVPGWGIFASTSRSKIHGGTVINCETGILLWDSRKTTVMDMESVANGFGIGVTGGSKNRILKNRIASSYLGITATEAPEGWGIETGTGHWIHQNLIVGSWESGIWAQGLEDSKISCNRADSNGVGISLIAPASGNVVRNNVANDNFFAGISAHGWFPSVYDPDGSPIPDGNVLKGNTATGNFETDLFEGMFDFPLVENPVDECLNVWRKNQYGTQVAVDSCIAPSKRFDDDSSDDSCAPGYGDNDSDDDSSSDD